MGFLIKQPGGFIFSDLASHPERLLCPSIILDCTVRTFDGRSPTRSSGTLEPPRAKTESHCSGFMRTTTRTGFVEAQRFD